MSRLIVCGAALAFVIACGNKKSADDQTPDNPAARTTDTKDEGPGAATEDAAAQSFVDALVKGDHPALNRIVPDAVACKAIPAFPECPQMQGVIDKMWDQLKTAGRAYAGAKVVKSKETPPFGGGQPWTATVPGKDPILVVTFKSGDRFFAMGKIRGVRPPSTGKEAPNTVAMKPAEAKELVSKALEQAKTPKPDCNQIANSLMLALPVAYPQVTAEAVPAYQTLQKCALETQRWRAAVGAGMALLPSKPGTFVIAQIPRALAEMGEYDQAISTATKLAKEFPEAEASLVSAIVFTFCRAEAWDKCLKASEAALAEFTKKKSDPKSEGMILNRFFRDLAWVVLGKPKEASADLVAIEKLLGKAPPFTAQVKVAAGKAIERGFYLDVVAVPQLATGVYHLMGKADTGSLLTLKLREQTGATRTFRVEAEVPGVTEKSSNSIEVGANQLVIRWVNPPLKMDFDPSKVRSPRPSQLSLKIVEVTKTGDKMIVDETLSIEVLPRDYLPLRRKVGADALVPTFGYIGAWITSNDKTVEAFLTKAKQRLPKKQFVGEQDTTVPQIKAVFDELKARGITYVMDPDVTSMQAFVQRTRLPADVLTSTNAQCLEGTLTFATLMEAIGIKPIVVFVPGHAFVGWHTVAADGTKGDPMFVETTMVGSYEFEQAVQVATDRVIQELKAGSFKSGAATLIDIAEIRKAGFTAQPM